MKKKIKAGIIGCGHIAGWNELDSFREKPCTHLGAYRSRKDVDVVGCCDIDIRRAKKFAKQFNVGFYTKSHKDLLSKKIDMLSICVPHKLHYKIAKDVLKNSARPRVIFMEKPISNDFNSAKKIEKLCAKKNVNLYVNNRRLSPFYETFKKIIKKEFNNEIISATAWCSSGMHAIGIHMVDLLRSICGDASWVFAAKENKKVKSLPFSYNFTPDDPRFFALIGFKNGIHATLLNSAQTNFTFFEIEVTCKTGRIRASDNGKQMVYQKKIKPGKSTLSFRLGKEKPVRVAQKPLFKQLIDEIIDGRYKNSLISGKEAVQSYKIIDAMKKSAKTNCIQKIR